MKELYITRHGQTEWNVAGRLQGISNSPLTEKGAADAERLGKRLAAVPIDKVFCSDLLRAQETAALIMQDRAPIVTDPRLRELHMGNWEAKLLQDLKEEEPEIYRQFETGSAGFHPAGGESMRTVWDRVKEALTEIEDDPADTALIVCHGKTQGLLLDILQGKEFGGDTRVLPGTALSHFVREEGVWRAVLLGDTRHIEGITTNEYQVE